jgi:hypothetical protein
MLKGESTLLKEVGEGQPNGRRQMGRPKKRR